MPNTDAWREYQLALTFQKAAHPVRLYVGLTSAALTVTSSISTAAAGEPSSDLGYARQTISLNGTDWTMQPITNHISTIRSKKVLFSNGSESAWASVDKAFVVARISDSPQSEILLGWAPLKRGAIALDPNEGVTVQVEEILKGA